MLLLLAGGGGGRIVGGSVCSSAALFFGIGGGFATAAAFPVFCSLNLVLRCKLGLEGLNLALECARLFGGFFTDEASECGLVNRTFSGCCCSNAVSCVLGTLGFSDAAVLKRSVFRRYNLTRLLY